MGKGKPLTHTAKSPGDRISGFNGLITQGPPELSPGNGVGRRLGVPRRRRAITRPLLPPLCLLFARTPVGGLLGPSEVEERARWPGSDSSRQCPEGQGALAESSGDPQ